MRGSGGGAKRNCYCVLRARWDFGFLGELASLQELKLHHACPFDWLEAGRFGDLH